MTTIPQATFGDELRRWRRTRRVSQLDLAIGAGVSQRHISFMETGRSRPSREMVIHLGESLDIGLRDRNALLVAAGFAPVYTETALDEPELDQVRGVLQDLLTAHEPYPAYVVDRRWDLVMANPSAAGLLTGLMAPDGSPELAGNVLRAALHPSGVRHRVRNWHRFAAALVHRLEREVAHQPHDSELAQLLAEVRCYPDVADLPARATLPSGSDLVVSVEVDGGDADLRFFTTIATIGEPFDVTLEELRIETLLPADETTQRWLRARAATSMPGAEGVVD